ncbi:Calcium permeable stress-gated cation channel 1 [Spathaspora sp. JA1]|nr:Calcium permeable stress-gated cation channel 1 [Spathaspora sp. JA1]
MFDGYSVSELVLTLHRRFLDEGNSGGDDGRYRPSSTRVARYQIIIASTLGLFALITFSILRIKYPKIYVANLNHTNFNYLHSSSRRHLPKLPAKSLFGWIPIVYKINESQVLEHAGLDAVVFLEFFKMCIKILVVCLVFAIAVISPVRYKYTGRMDSDPDDDNGTAGIRRVIGETNDDRFKLYLLGIYTIFTYVFTLITVYFLFKQTNKIINMRQKYLGGQNSITDRTVKVSGIPAILRDEIALTRHIEGLGIGEIDSVLIVREWQNLNKLFKLRKRVLRKLEQFWIEYFHENGIINKSQLLSASFQPQPSADVGLQSEYHDDVGESEEEVSSTNTDAQSQTSTLMDQISEIIMDASNPGLLDDGRTPRPTIRKGWFGILGPKVDAIDYYTDQLEVIDREISRARTREYSATSTAFLTMKSVAQAQMLAQAVLDPKVNHLITSLAPAPHDIRWDNLCLTRKERNTRIFTVTMAIGFVSIAMIYPVRFLASFLNIKSISKVWPSLGNALKNSKWATTLITGLLPTYIFTIFNIIIPFFYVWISEKQGFTSHSDEELASVAKNFFYIFVNLFLVFTTFGTASLSNTTKIAYDLAQSLRDLSLFYVDFIILQGLGIFPFKLLLLGNLIRFPIESLIWCKTPRDYLKLYKPPVFNFGLQLPQPMLIFIITLIYSIMSSKILSVGLIYFIIGYFVSKYQLLYACVHPPHSTGKVWPLAFRRIILGLFIFQLTMAGTLLLQEAFIFASLLAPLPMLTLYFLWSFQYQYIPLSMFIALRAIENEQREEDPESDIGGQNKTLDETRELNTKYEYPNLVRDLDGPLIAIDGEDVLVINKDGQTVRKFQDFTEWYN